MYYNIKLKRVRVTIFGHGKSIRFTYAEGMSVAIVIQHPKGKGHIILSIVACVFLRHFSTLPHKRHDFWRRNLLNIKCVLPISKTFAGNRPISSAKKNSVRYKCK
jgi:hypothetical protein